jgi:hypothetical protein
MPASQRTECAKVQGGMAGTASSTGSAGFSWAGAHACGLCRYTLFVAVAPDQQATISCPRACFLAPSRPLTCTVLLAVQVWWLRGSLEYSRWLLLPLLPGRRGANFDVALEIDAPVMRERI